MSNFSIDTGTKAGTVGGTFLGIIINVPSEDIIKTIVLAGLGAVVSFGVSLLMKVLVEGIKRKRRK